MPSKVLSGRTNRISVPFRLRQEVTLAPCRYTSSSAPFGWCRYTAQQGRANFCQCTVAPLPSCAPAIGTLHWHQCYAAAHRLRTRCCNTRMVEEPRKAIKCQICGGLAA